MSQDQHQELLDGSDTWQRNIMAHFTPVVGGAHTDVVPGDCADLEFTEIHDAQGTFRNIWSSILNGWLVMAAYKYVNSTFERLPTHVTYETNW